MFGTSRHVLKSLLLHFIETFFFQKKQISLFFFKVVSLSIEEEDRARKKNH